MSNQSNNISRRIQIDPQNVPENLHSLIPYAEKWSIGDYTELINTINETPIEELRELVKSVSESDIEGFDEWLASGDAPVPTKEWRSFILLIDACDVIKTRMKQNRLPAKNNNKTTN